MSRIDFFLVSDDIQSEVKSCEFLFPLSSDHSPVKLKMQSISTDTRGRGYWKFNNSLLEKKQFVSDMKNKINEVVSTFGDFDDPRINWEYLKFKIREFSRDTAIKLAKARKLERENLEFKVNSYEKIINPSEDELRDIENAKVELEKIYDHITNGIMLRSKAQWYEGKKASKYFLSLDENRKAKTCIRKFKLDLYGEIVDPQLILLELKLFYKNLYKKTSVKTEKECLHYLSQVNTPNLSPEEKGQCEGKLSLQECWDALNSMKNGKSPGNDGLTKEFYTAFFGELGSHLLETFNYSFVKGELTSSQKQAVITLIQKKDRDVMLIKNWRPISLINVDVKITSKVLAFRVRNVLPSLIHYDQTAYVKGRYIGESVRLIDDLLKYAEEENSDGILFAADIEKAFDSVDHNFIYATLKKFGFGSDFIQWIKTLFKNSQSCVMNNRNSTGYFNLERGTRQGDHLSPDLFILALEVLFI